MEIPSLAFDGCSPRRSARRAPRPRHVRQPGWLADGHRWDIGNIGADPARADHIAFTAPYCEIDSTYLVRGDSPIVTLADVDRPGVRIVTKEGAAYTLWLERNIATQN